MTQKFSERVLKIFYPFEITPKGEIPWREDSLTGTQTLRGQSENRFNSGSCRPFPAVSRSLKIFVRFRLTKKCQPFSNKWLVAPTRVGDSSGVTGAWRHNLKINRRTKR